VVAVLVVRVLVHLFLVLLRQGVVEVEVVEIFQVVTQQEQVVQVVVEVAVVVVLLVQ
jgi:hypothetical protein